MPLLFPSPLPIIQHDQILVQYTNISPFLCGSASSALNQAAGGPNYIRAKRGKNKARTDYICIMRTRDENKERAIRIKAMEFIVKEGFDGLSMHKLAQAAGVSVATIYIYYNDREDLILSLCREETIRMTEATLKNFSPDMPFAEGLRIQWKNRSSFWLQNPIEAQFLERMRHSPYQEQVVRFLKKDFTDAMYLFVKNAVKNKELIKLPVEVFWSIAYAPLYQLVKYHLDGVSLPGAGPFSLDDKTMKLALQLVIKALKP